jgi:hypothetical protein
LCDKNEDDMLHMKKRVPCIFLFTQFLWSLAFSQTVTPIAPGDGTLAAAITAAAPGDILQLTGGAEYTHSSSANFAVLNKPITIQVEPGSAHKAIIKLFHESTWCLADLKRT